MDAMSNLDDITQAIRLKLTSQEELNDEKAFNIIADYVFLASEKWNITAEEIAKTINKIFLKTRRHFGVLTPLIEDEDVSEIMVNDYDKIFFEKNGQIIKWEMGFDSERELEEIMQKIASEVHREINELSPIVDARLKDGSRVNGVYKNIAVSGPTLTIRKFSENYMKMSDLVANETLTDKAASLLGILVSCGYNIFVSGGTS